MSYYEKQDEEHSRGDPLMPSNTLFRMRLCALAGDISNHLTFLNVPMKVLKLF